MWNSFHRRHCSDEQLLAYLDGELAILRSEWVKRHLNLCWDCRNRANELEVQTQGVARALRDDSLAEPQQIEQAKLQFLTRRREFERSFTPPAGLPFHFSPRTGLMASVCAIAMLVFVGGSAPRKLEASEILARIRGEEKSLYATPLLVHQTFRIRMSQIQPESRERTGRLEIWSDAKRQRFASRWQDDSGNLRHAVWRPDREREYVYNSKIAPTISSSKTDSSNEIQSLADLSGSALDLEKLESGVMEWIETRQWRPIEASSDLNAFVSSEGAILRAEQNETRICLQAERAVGRRRIELSVELDPGSYKPRLQRIRFEDAGRVLEVELTAGPCEFVSVTRVAANVFEPEKTLVASLPPVVSRQTASPTVESAPVEFVDAADLTPLEIEAHYALHRARACLGEPVEVLQNLGKKGQGFIEINGFVETQDRKKELHDALAELVSVRVNITTAEEALLKSPRPAATAIEPESEAGIQLSSRPLPIQGALEELFNKDRPNSATSQRIAEFSIQAISLSQSALSHAWALRRLAERYGEKKKSDLLPRSRWLLEVMIRDHITAVDTENRRTRSLLDPLLWQVQSKSVIALASRAPAADDLLDWRKASLNVFATTKRMDTLIRALFAGADLYQGPEKAAHTEGVSKLVEDLIETFQRLDFDLLRAGADTSEIPGYRLDSSR